MSDIKKVSIMVADYEIPTKIFIEILKYNQTGIWASPSHAQDYPDRIDFSAILKWKIDDDGVYAITKGMKVVRLSKDMPAMKLVLVEEENK